MYHSNLRISICSNSSIIQDSLKSIPEFERFEHHIQTYGQLVTSEIIEGSDVVVLDLPFSRDNLQLFNNHKKKDARLIICVDTELMSRFDMNDYQLFDDMWIKPLNDAQIAFYFSKLQQQLKLEKDYELSNKYLDTLIDSIPDLVWFKDLQGAHLKVNNSFCRAVNKTKEDIQGRGHYYIWGIDEADYKKGEFVCLETEEAVLREKKTCLFDEKVKCHEEMRQFKTFKSPIFGHHDEVIGTVGIAHDVTDIRNMDAELQIIIEHLPFAVLFYDQGGTILNVNKKFINYFNVCKERIIGEVYDSWETANISLIKGNRKDKKYQAKMQLVDKEIIMQIYQEPIMDIFNKITGYFHIYVDITLEYNWQKEILHYANTDYLTGLFNRRYLYKILNQQRKERRLSLLYIDIDNFKSINDYYGHKDGDKALVNIAKLLMTLFPKHQIFRLGGDEFLVIITNQQSIETIERYAQKVIESVRNYARITWSTQSVSASIGIVDDDLSISIDELIKRGDAALYMAKKLGKNRYFCWQEITDVVKII